MPRDLLAGHKRMRASLVNILPLDPRGIAARIAEMDREIARLSDLLQPERMRDDGASAKARPDFIAIGPVVRAA